jgi:hypothetical protein
VGVGGGEVLPVAVAPSWITWKGVVRQCHQGGRRGWAYEIRYGVPRISCRVSVSDPCFPTIVGTRHLGGEPFLLLPRP